MPADGCAMCVQLSVFKVARLKLALLYDRDFLQCEANASSFTGTQNPA
jgi:hypothetical protein